MQRVFMIAPLISVNLPRYILTPSRVTPSLTALMRRIPTRQSRSHIGWGEADLRNAAQVEEVLRTSGVP
jgi:hypothetical protein